MIKKLSLAVPVKYQYMKSCGDPDGLTSEIYKVDTIVYGSYNVGTWRFHLYVLFQLLIQLLQVQFRYGLKIPNNQNKTQVIHLIAKYSRQAESEQSCTGIIMT